MEKAERQSQQPDISEPEKDTESFPLSRIAFDLEAYALRYIWWQGSDGRCLKRGALTRLLHIATNAPREELRKEAARLGLQILTNNFSEAAGLALMAPCATKPCASGSALEVRRWGDSPPLLSPGRSGRSCAVRGESSLLDMVRQEPVDLGLYAEFKRILDEPIDVAFTCECKDAFAKYRNSLLRGLEISQQKGIDQAVRSSYNELAHFYYEHGYLDESLRYLQMMEARGMQKHELLCWILDILRIHLEKLSSRVHAQENRGPRHDFAAQYPQFDLDACHGHESTALARIPLQIDLRGDTSRIEQLAHIAETSLEEKDIAEATALQAGLALVALHNGHYRRAVKHFLAVTTAFRDSGFTDMISSDDIALHAVLCAIATLNREEILEWILQNRSFLPILDQNPISKELLNSFFNRKFPDLLRSLRALQHDLSMDLYMHSHTEGLTRLIRHRCYVAYVRPFRRIRLSRMKFELLGSDSFDASSDDSFERDLEWLLRQGCIQGQLHLEEDLLEVNSYDGHALMIASVLDEASSSWAFCEKETLRFAYSTCRMGFPP
jgi:hypothetical protein